MKLQIRLFILALGLAMIPTAPSFAEHKDQSEGASHKPDPRRTEENTYDQKSIIDVTSDFLGAGSGAVAKVVEKVFSDLGRPNGYIVGSEGSGAIVVGLRYGDGKLTHKVEGEQRVYWTGPSVGFDLGGNASRVVTLVYDLYDTEDLFHRYPAVEGSFYYIGGIGVNYNQRGHVILAPIRVGVGLRAGVNLGYLSYSKKRKWVPF
jgi:hypothetical protein